MKKLKDDKRHIPYQRGNQRDKSPHYVFLYSDDEVEDEEIPLQLRKQHKSLPKKIEVIIVNLKPEDTLQALSLRYHCTISELKRINNIHKENEIYARRVIKIPVQPFSVLTENEKLIDIDDQPDLLDPIPSSSSSAQLIINLSDGNVSKETDINTLILNSVCEPSNKFMSNQDIDINADDETNELLAREPRDSTPEAKVIDSFKCSGADWGLSLIHLILLFLLLGIILPIIYIFYIAEHSDHHIIINNNSNNDSLIKKI